MPDDFTTVPSPMPPLMLQGKQIELRNCVLEVDEGPDASACFGPLGEQTTIGRAPWSEIGLNDPQVSKLHCELVRSGDGMRLRDLGSQNGVYFGDVRIDSAVFCNSFKFRIGQTKLRLMFLPGTQPYTSTVLDQSGTLVGRSPPMKRLFSMLERIAPQEMPVLLLGETGTGKTAVAAAIHKTSSRKHGPFTVVNCAGIPAELAESELFGHVRGAFTGAQSAKKGLLELASGGTLFLDEIGELPLWIQGKLLTVLDSGVFRPVGGTEEVRGNFRLICATNRDLPEDAKAHSFRQDLYYRISTMSVTVPPLRDRGEDFPMLAEWFIVRRIRSMNAAGFECPVGSISPQAIRVLERHPWIGNVREFESVISKSMTFAKKWLLEPEDILLEEYQGDVRQARVEGAEGPRKLYGNQLPLLESRALHDRDYIRDLLRETGGNVTRVAQISGVTRQYMHTLMKKLGLTATGDTTGRILHRLPVQPPPVSPDNTGVQEQPATVQPPSTRER